MNLDIIMGVLLILAGIFLSYCLTLKLLFRKWMFKFYSPEALALKSKLTRLTLTASRIGFALMALGVLTTGVCIIILHSSGFDVFPSKKGGGVVESAKSILIKTDLSYAEKLAAVRIARWLVLASGKSAAIYNDRTDTIKITTKDKYKAACQIAHELRHRQQYKEGRGGRNVENEVEAWTDELKIYEKLKAQGFVDVGEDYKLKVLKRDEREFKEMIYLSYKEEYQLK